MVLLTLIPYKPLRAVLSINHENRKGDGRLHNYGTLFPFFGFGLLFKSVRGVVFHSIRLFSIFLVKPQRGLCEIGVLKRGDMRIAPIVCTSNL